MTHIKVLYKPYKRVISKIYRISYEFIFFKKKNSKKTDENLMKNSNYKSISYAESAAHQTSIWYNCKYNL